MRINIMFLVVTLSFLSGKTVAQQDYRAVPSAWGFSWGAGLGTMVPGGNLGNMFNAGFAGDTEINLYYQNVFLMINGGFSSNSLSSDIRVISSDGVNETYWPSGSNSIHAFIGGNVGVNLYTINNISVYPFVGAGYGFMEPSRGTAKNDQLLRELKIDSFLWNVGLGVDYNFPDKNYTPGSINRILKIGLRYQYQKPNFDNNNEVENFEGANHWLSLRFVIGSSMPGKRIYN